jgi:hypothetical protein
MRCALFFATLFAASCTSEEPARPELSDGGEVAPADQVPRALSETGLYTDIAKRTLASGVAPYDVRYELWSDGAEKQRYLFLPGGAQIDTSDANGWKFPIGTKAWKTFFVEGRAIETRLLQKISDEQKGWTQLAFVWSDDGRDAYAAPDGLRDALSTSHDVPSSEDCFKCHRGAADILIGVAALQATAASIDTWLAEGRLTHGVPTMRDPPGDRPTRELLGYIHANCGHCHNDRHPLAREEPLRLELPLGIARPEDTPLYRTSICVDSLHQLEGTTKVVLPGDPQGSELFLRMQLRGDVQMPPLAAERPDDDALTLVSSWIDSLDRCE